MTIEINRQNSMYIYRVNPWNPRLIDRRLNRHRARWEPYRDCVTEVAARSTLLQIEKQMKDEGK